MEAKLDRMTEMVGDGCNTAIPSSYCDTSGADKVGEGLLSTYYKNQCRSDLTRVLFCIELLGIRGHKLKYHCPLTRHKSHTP